MRSIRRLGDLPAGRSLAADDLLEFHAARLLLLLHLCGTAGRIDGLTKLAKLDFFVRYPQFFNEAVAREGQNARSATQTVESSMIRHHYGPWDKRYYRVLPYLEGCGLIQVRKEGNAYRFELTGIGREAAKRLAGDRAFEEMVQQMQQVKKAFGGRAGSALKRLIYEVFDREVGQKKLGEVIR
ncbi:hypothetical protein [Deinococcus budaensis]|uniref:Uncharacterized protein n=1 Tax=Deinococcus budaensis TaxID=1665626 RepID=A0A7W8GER8_9DEIO|nr:hypothetical protein [Deinococcus budaensis]MBB5234163.1 hypothetical protein [Deinococcus budaensis]